MDKKYSFFIIDDDPVSVKLLVKFLESDGQTVHYKTSSVDVVSEIIALRPDCVILDIMMPHFDGLEILKQLRSIPELNYLKAVIVSGKSYEFDRKRARSFGADGYIVKPVKHESFFLQIKQIMEDKIKISFWGVHGTLPVPGLKTVRYGGNTSCVSMEFSKGDFFVFDAGTGIKVLSDYLTIQKRERFNIKLFISHPHWDHIHGLPFFIPLYIQGNECEIMGPAHGDITMRELISGQMDGVYFPINIKEFGARVYFRDLKEENFNIDDIKIKTLLLNHPGHCLGYRIEYKNKVICYVTDNEIFPKTTLFYSESYYGKLLKFISGADVLITDCTYNDHEYDKKMSWGHSSVTEVITLADIAKVKNLYLFHHDISDTDKDIDNKLRFARKALKKKGSSTNCIAPKEKQFFEI